MKLIQFCLIAKVVVDVQKTAKNGKYASRDGVFAGSRVAAAFALLPGAAAGVAPLEYICKAFRCGDPAGPLVPGAALPVRPLDDLEVAILRGSRANKWVPGAVPLPRPFHDLEVVVFRGFTQRRPVPAISVVAELAETLEIAVSRGSGTVACVLAQSFVVVVFGLHIS